MSLRVQFNDALKEAMRAKEQRALGTVRMILAALKEADIDARGKGNKDGISDAEIMGLLQKLIKQRRDSIVLYQQGNRPELVQQETEEIAVIERFLPKQMAPEEAKKAIQALVKELGASSIKDMGRVMTEVKTRYAGQMDTSQASAWVKEALGGKG